MAFRQDEPDEEFYGINYGVFGKAFKFQYDFWDDAEFLPQSQCTWVPDPDSDEQGRGTMFIPAWLVRKNGWKR